MGRTTLRTAVDASRETAFDRLADIKRMPEYSTLTRDVSAVGPLPVGSGTRWVEDNPIGPVRTRGEGVVEEFDRPDRLVFKGTATFVDSRVAFEFEDQNGATRIEQATDYEFLPQPGPVGRLLDELAFKRVLTAGERESMLNFKRAVERDEDE